MAYAKYNTSLEYSANVLEFWNTNDNEVAEAFDLGTTFSIRRSDTEESIEVSAIAEDSASGYIKFALDLSEGTTNYDILHDEDDQDYDYDRPNYDHVYSLKSPTRTYLIGKLNMVKVA